MCRMMKRLECVLIKKQNPCNILNYKNLRFFLVAGTVRRGGLNLYPDASGYDTRSSGGYWTMSNGRVVVSKSGGVDSSVAALLRSLEGYEVIGVTLHLCSDERPDAAPLSRACCTR